MLVPELFITLGKPMHNEWEIRLFINLRDEKSLPPRLRLINVALTQVSSSLKAPQALSEGCTLDRLACWNLKAQVGFAAARNGAFPQHNPRTCPGSLVTIAPPGSWSLS